jgi:hypothetical protein
MKSRISLGACLALVLSVLGQTASGQQAATVHIYRNGSRGNAIQVLVDGAEVFELGEHQMTTFALPPGHHEVSARYASQQPAVAIDAEPGSQYFLQVLMNVRHGVLGAMADPAMAIAVTLTREEGVLNADQIREQPLSQNEKDFIAFKISQAHPAGPMQVAESSQAPAPPPPATPAKTVAPPRTFADRQPTVGPGQAYSVKYAGGNVTDAQVGKSLQLRIGASIIQLGALLIPSDSVTAIALSQDKHHRIGTGIAVSMVTLGAGIPIMFSKSTKDFIQITWNDAGAKGGAAFQADKNEYRGILAALEGVTGKTATMPTGN